MSRQPRPEGAEPVLKPYRLAFTTAGGRVSRRSYAYREPWLVKVRNLSAHGVLLEFWEETDGDDGARPDPSAGKAAGPDAAPGYRGFPTRRGMPARDQD